LYEQPDKFMPERWAKISPSSYEYFPFACLPRICVGRNFATMEAMTFFALVFRYTCASLRCFPSHVCRDFSFEVVKPLDRNKIDWYFALTLHASGGLWVKVRRNAPLASVAAR